jgi:nucleoside-diphosphate-sugar epimerase
MTRALVTGAGGFIGPHLVAALKDAGWKVVVVSSSQPSDYVDVYEAPLAEVDVVFHLAGLAHEGVAGSNEADLLRVNSLETKALFEACLAKGVRRFVWLSSLKVLGDEAAQPLVVESSRDPKDAYARSKAQGEEGLLTVLSELAIDPSHLAIVRSPLVYGVGVKANFLSMLRWAVSGLPLPLAAARAGRAWVNVDNLVSLLVAAATRDLHGHVMWHVADDEQSSVSDMLRAISEANESASRIWYLPSQLLRWGCVLLGKKTVVQRLLSPLKVDVSQSKTLLGWQPVKTQKQALSEVAAWYRTQR